MASGNFPIFNKNLKKPLFLAAFLLIFCLPAAAQNQYPPPPEYKASINLGPEWNMNSSQSFAGGLSLGFDRNLPHLLSFGLNVTASYDLSDVTVLEIGALFRRYFFKMGHNGLYIQGELGTAMLIMPDYDPDFTTLFMGGVRLGFRIPVHMFYVERTYSNHKSLLRYHVPFKVFYIEPYGRGGYPYVFGLGALAGVQF